MPPLAVDRARRKNEVPLCVLHVEYWRTVLCQPDELAAGNYYDFHGGPPPTVNRISPTEIRTGPQWVPVLSRSGGRRVVKGHTGSRGNAALRVCRVRGSISSLICK